jgi:hypothetical protein
MTLIEHLQEYWTNHLGAIAAAGVSISIGSAFQSILVGVSVFLVTNILRGIWNLIYNKLKNKGNCK